MYDEKAISKVLKAMPTSGLVFLAGMQGCGKTEVALRLARSRDGFVPLFGIGERIPIHRLDKHGISGKLRVLHIPDLEGRKKALQHCLELEEVSFVALEDIHYYWDTFKIGEDNPQKFFTGCYKTLFDEAGVQKGTLVLATLTVRHERSLETFRHFERLQEVFPDATYIKMEGGFGPDSP